MGQTGVGGGGGIGWGRAGRAVGGVSGIARGGGLLGCAAGSRKSLTVGIRDPAPERPDRGGGAGARSGARAWQAERVVEGEGARSCPPRAGDPRAAVLDAAGATRRAAGTCRAGGARAPGPARRPRRHARDRAPLWPMRRFWSLRPVVAAICQKSCAASPPGSRSWARAGQSNCQTTGGASGSCSGRAGLEAGPSDEFLPKLPQRERRFARVRRRRLPGHGIAWVGRGRAG